ncbi:hypothetical protein BKA57DRAFT_454029 [Linnemannia elongata]|nr:hypothetical protein BKA57DRAFT_454029 [Linnemannia elongata]
MADNACVPLCCFLNHLYPDRRSLPLSLLVLLFSFHHVVRSYLRGMQTHKYADIRCGYHSKERHHLNRVSTKKRG